MDPEARPTYRPVVRQLATEIGVLGGLAVLVALVWALAGEPELAETLRFTLLIAAGLRLLGAGTVLPKATRLATRQWGVRGGDDRELTGHSVNDDRAPVELAPAAAAIVVAVVLGLLSLVLDLYVV